MNGCGNKIGPYDCCTIVTGDAKELALAIPDESVDLLVTDPPYFLPAQSYVGTRKLGYIGRTLADTSIPGHFFGDLFDEVGRALKSAGSAYLFCDGQSYPLFYVAMFRHFKYIRPLIWDKVVSYNGYTWRHQHELIAWGEGEEAQRVPTGDGDILRCRGVLQKDRRHPAEKPVALLQQLIGKHKEAQVILDPFTGSGSTPVAAWLEGRHYLAFEIDPDVAERARERVRNTQPPLFVLQAEQLEFDHEERVLRECGL